LVALAAIAEEKSGAFTPAVREILNKPGDLTLRETPLGEALFTIGEEWSINLVVDSKIEGQVSGTFKETPLHEILDSILLSHGYSYRPVGQSLVVMPLEDVGDVSPLLETATIPVRFASPTEIVKAAELLRSPRGKVEPVPAAKILVVTDFPDRVARIRTLVGDIDTLPTSGPSARPEDADQIDVMHFTTRYVKAEAVVEACRSVLSREGKEGNKETGKAASLKSGNQLVVSGTPQQLALVSKLIRQIDIPQPQVRIRALIYDISLEDMEELGLNWRSDGKFRQNRANEPQSVLSIDTVTRVPFANSPVDGAITFASLSRHFDITAVLNALRQANNSRLIADPSVAVLNNEQALMQIVQEVPYQELTQTSGGGNIGTTSFKEVGVKLQVTPQIADDGTIQMDVNPSFSRLAGFTPNTDQPIIDRREANTHVRVANGQTLVIGGLRQRSDNGLFLGVPYLEDHRWVGALFRSRSTTARESELVVFLTPEIIKADVHSGARDQAALDSSDSLLDTIPIVPEIQPTCKPCPRKFCPQGAHSYHEHPVGMSDTSAVPEAALITADSHTAAPASSAPSPDASSPISPSATGRQTVVQRLRGRLNR
jgi:general secretion pathway protein D